MGDLKELLGTIEAATGPDRELDVDLFRLSEPDSDIFKAWDPPANVTWTEVGGFWKWNAAWGRFYACSIPFPKYTSSLDAAIALVEKRLPGIFWLVGKGKTRAAEPPFGCHLMFGTDEIIAEGEAATGPLAVLIALLKAEISNRSAST